MKVGDSSKHSLRNPRPRTSTDTSYSVGYGKPPKSTRWKKGQTGNPRQSYKSKKRIVDLIDEFLAGEIEIAEAGIRRHVTAFEAICMQLWAKAMGGNKRALNVFLQYEQFAAKRGETGGFRVVILPEEHFTSGKSRVPPPGDQP
jgi:hypothetical protein